MPEGLVRTIASYRDGFGVTGPISFGTTITEPHTFGIVIPVVGATFAGSPITLPHTFGNTIAPAILGTQATPTFSPVAGAYVGTQSVTISSSGADNIYYTTDGSTPTTSSTLYTGAVSVAASETLKAIATAAGKSNSAVGTAAYTISAPAAPAIVQTAVLNTVSNLNGDLVFGSPMTAGNSVYAFISTYQNNRTISSVVDDQGVNVYTLVSGPDGAGDSTDGSTQNYIYKCENLVGAPTTITVTLNLGQYKMATAVEVSVAVGFPTIDHFAYVSTAASATPQPLTGPDVVSSGDAELLLGYVASENGNYTYTPNTGWNAVLTNSNPSNASTLLMKQVAATAGTYSSTGGTASAATGTGNYAVSIKR
jgi:hypothetical protein